VTDLKDWFFALGTGALVGFAFAKLKLPVPAPPTLAGVLGIIGITLGYIIGKR
jgi:XapX domain-containing protein